MAKIDARWRGMPCAALFGLAVLASSSVAAEPVAIVSSTRANGFGWLFGSPNDGECWIATPLHVIELTRGGEPGPFVWRSQSGIEGTGEAPIAPEATLDLAFARASGIEPGKCLSRLGVADLSSALGRYPVAEAVSPLKTQVRPRRLQLRDFDADVIRIEPVDGAARKAFQSGISGSPLLEVEGEGRDPRPLGLILSVDPKTNQGAALRFDTIRRVFLTLQGSADRRHQPSASLNYKIVNSTAISPDPAASSAALAAGGCWSAAPPAGERSFRFEIVAAREFQELTIVVDPRCGSAADAVVIEAPTSSSWYAIAQCTFDGTTTACVRQLTLTARARLTVIRRDGAIVSLGAMTIK